MENLENVIESVLFVAGEPILISDLCYKFNVTSKEIAKAVEILKQKYDENSGIQLLCFNNKLQLSSNSKYVDFVASVLNPIRERTLTRATLETVAIIAYKQPITRLEIEEIRGVNSDYAIGILLDHKLIEIVGHKDTVGKPSLFATTDEFLKRFNIENIAELPDYDSLLEQIEKIKQNHSSDLYSRDEEVQVPNETDLDKQLADAGRDVQEKNEDVL